MLVDQNLIVGEAIFEPRLEEVVYYFVGDLLFVGICDYLVQRFHAYFERFFQVMFTVY